MSQGGCAIGRPAGGETAAAPACFKEAGSRKWVLVQTGAKSVKWKRLCVVQASARSSFGQASVCVDEAWAGWQEAEEAGERVA